MTVGPLVRSMHDGTRDDVDIESHLREALARAENGETRYHLREALQKRLIEKQFQERQVEKQFQGRQVERQ